MSTVGDYLKRASSRAIDLAEGAADALCRVS